MVREGNAESCFRMRLWCIAVLGLALLSACFIVSCVVTYYFTHGNIGKRLSELHTHHSNLTCFSEGTRVTEKIWGCCPGTWKPFGSSCYFISSEENFWAKSEQNCIGMGAHLVVINTETEQTHKGMATGNGLIRHLTRKMSDFGTKMNPTFLQRNVLQLFSGMGEDGAGMMFSVILKGNQYVR
ncbi:C-type lectin domain family 6 member A isoform X2 [Bos indicus x Bos taurus]|uniref:C-type lectin domain family 6 member A isoform X2 n=1 Tax=Bos indicus x Bos taurus TaxID=30522 RepID=UPI000383B457|nr:PREDICTED: C-type lectin domain family 6 member A isoform X2 [Bos indicus]XP_027397032.1 C-type lectin domain family 6 member A isoform X2 [Bos indicus x Bos taurus]XP_059742360.1 C-type lectin domain family 6 member A isoform X2 [Bos taurus]